MLCQNCEKNDATTHIKQIINGEMSESHLCSECAKMSGINDMFPDFSTSLSEFFGNFFGDMLPSLGAGNVLKCRKCGCTFDDIVREGKVGCAGCYETFYDKLLPSLQRIHGKPRHIGKVSPTYGKSFEKAESENTNEKAQENSTEEKEAKIAQLREKIKEAVAEENYELAAQLRDEIKKQEGENAQ